MRSRSPDLPIYVVRFPSAPFSLNCISTGGEDNWNVSMPRRTIAILFHENNRKRHLSNYAITFLAEFWRKDGNRVRYLFGTRKFVPADLLLIHVDLSVVPDEYLEFANRYPIALNRAAKDIRKSLISANLVRSSDPYSGKVIVKTDLNYGGSPERIIRRNPSLWRRLLLRRFDRDNTDRSGFKAPFDYEIYDSLAEVPPVVFERNDVVVEKFLSEQEENLFFVRHYEFLGDRATCTRLAATNPIVKDQTLVRIEEVEPHPEIVQARERLNFEYCKFDYVLHDGRPVLLDANKTTGADRVSSRELNTRRRHRANGIYSYFA